MKRIRCRVYGRVQGVFFRATAREYATNLGLKGWIKNVYDGSVEGVFEGEEEAVNKMIEWCKKGPPHAFVEKHEFVEEEYTGEFNDFSIKY